MQYGMTYMVRPAMQPSNSASILAWPSAGDIQWLFGPASSFSGVQTKVRCSTRATSSGCERCSQLLGCVSGLSGNRVPSACIFAMSSAFSLSLPSHQWMAAGRVSRATPATHSFSASSALPAVCMEESFEIVSLGHAFMACLGPDGHRWTRAGAARSGRMDQDFGISVAIMCSM